MADPRTDHLISEGERSLPHKYCRFCGEHTATQGPQGVWRCPNPDHPAVPGGCHKVLARGANYKGQPYTAPYLAASIDAVHSYGCPATRMGKRGGPCNCGARDLMVEFLADLADLADHADDPWTGVTHLLHGALKAEEADRG